MGSVPAVDILFDSEQIDTENNFDIASHAFTAPTDGYYLLQITILVANQPANAQLGILAQKNGSTAVAESYSYGGNGGSLTVNLVDSVKLSKGETIKILGYSDANTTINASRSKLIILSLATMSAQF